MTEAARPRVTRGPGYPRAVPVPEAPETAPHHRHAAAARLLSQYRNPEHDPVTKWNGFPVKDYFPADPVPVDPADHYPAVRGFDTPQTRALRIAEDAAFHGRQFARDLGLAVYAQTEEARASRQRMADELRHLNLPGYQLEYQPKNEAELAIIEIHREHRGQAAEFTLDRFTERHQTGAYLIYLGLERQETALLHAGLALMHRARHDLDQALLRRQPAAIRAPFRQWLDKVQAAAAHLREPELYLIRRHAAGRVNISVFNRLSRDFPDWDPELDLDDRQTAVRAIHENVFRFRQGEPWRRAMNTLSLGREREYERTLGANATLQRNLIWLF